MLQALLGDDAGLVPLTQLLIARTQGNPFFLEESVRTLVETGVLVGERGAYRLDKPLDTLQMPATVQAVLAARIDRLPPEEKRLLQTAAVIGTEVPLPLLHAIAEVPEDALQRGLARLQAAEFVYETRLFPECAYTFKHALTHEVAYGSLLRERRRVLHTRIIAHLEAIVGTQGAEQVERLAHHAFRGEVWDKSLAYSRQAGEKALARLGSREAVGYFEQALSALTHLPEQRDTREQGIDLRLALRTALRPLGEERRLLATLHEAEALAVALDDPRRLGQVAHFLAHYFTSVGAYAQAIAAAQRALALATAPGDVVQQALAHFRLGQAYHTQSDYRGAIDGHTQTVAALDGARRFERFGIDTLPAVASRAWLAVCHAELGRFAEGRALGDEGLQLAEAVAHRGSVMHAAWGIGVLALRQGDLTSAYSEHLFGMLGGASPPSPAGEGGGAPKTPPPLPRAFPQLERAVHLCQEADLPLFFPRMAATLSVAYTLGGRVADAQPLLTQAMARAMAPARAEYPALCRLLLGEAQLLAGSLEEAHTCAERALVLAREHQERGNKAYALHLLGDIAARRAPPESELAEAHYHQALTLADALGMRPLQAHCHRGLGTLYAATGQREQARAALATAVEMYQVWR